MRRAQICVIGIGFLGLVGCSADFSLYDSREVDISGRVTTEKGVPVEAVQVSTTYVDPFVLTDSDGRYQFPVFQRGGCKNVSVHFRKGMFSDRVHVGKCGRQEVNYNTWPDEG